MEYTLGSIDELSNLYRAGTVELIRRFSAKKIQEDKYLIPAEKIPWYAVIDLGQDYPLITEEGVLVVDEVEIEPKNVLSHIDIPIGFLVKKSDAEYLCLGVMATGRSRLATCHIRNYGQPYDLWEFPKSIQVPQVTFVGVDVSASKPFRVRVPLECIQWVMPELLAELSKYRTRYLVVLTDFVALVGKVKIRLDLSRLHYSWS